MTSKAIYFPGLNGLRAIAAIGVVISHITLGLKDFNLDPTIFGVDSDGKPKGLLLAGFGVSVFFVLSGFLITYLLQAEKKMQPIDVKKFYFRRILRIWPLYYLYLIIAVITIITFGLNSDFKLLFYYLFYSANIPFVLATTLPLLAHYWSLGVEEQFYLFWPWVVKKANKYIVLVIVFLIILLLGTKVCLHFFYPNTLIETAIHVTRFHCMLIGALGAILYGQGNMFFLKIIDNKISQSICWLIIVLVAINKFHMASIVDNEIISIVSVFLIIGQIKIKNRIVNLEINVLDFLGKISYGIYVIHPLLVFMFSKIFWSINIQKNGKYFMIYFIVLSSTIFLSYLSYNYYEKYFLNLKRKFAVINSTATKKIKAN